MHEYGLLWGGSTNPRQDADASLKHAEEICKQFIERKISGVFFAPAELQLKQEVANFQIAESLREAGIPVVLIDRDLTAFPKRSDFDLVGIDNVAGGIHDCRTPDQTGLPKNPVCVPAAFRPDSECPHRRRPGGPGAKRLRTGFTLGSRKVGSGPDVKFVAVIGFRPSGRRHHLCQ